jgi:hypothetical protein
MGERILMNVRFDAENGDYKPGAINLTNIQVAQAAAGADARIVSVGTSEADITFGVTTHGYLLLRNLDDTNYIKYGPKSSGVMVELGRLKAGEIAVLRVAPGATFRAVADTAACNLWVHMEND